MKSRVSTTDANASLIRPEALEGKAYSRLANPFLLANPSLLRPLIMTWITATLIVALLFLLPLTNSHRGYGVVSAAVNSRVVRAPKQGQLTRIVNQGERIVATGEIALIEHLLQTEGGRNPTDGYTGRLHKLTNERDGDIKLLEERFTLSISLADQAERSLVEQIASVENSIRNQSRLVTEAEALTARISNFAAYVTRLDSLALSERTVGAQNHLLDLRAQEKKLRTELSEKIRSKRILEIDHVREKERIRQKFRIEEAALLEKVTNQNFVVPSPLDGDILAVYKKRGDWVAAGDEIALVGEKFASKSKTLSIQIPAELANLLAKKQFVRVWPNGTRRSDSPLVGLVQGIEQRTPEGYRVSGQQPGSAIGSFVALVALDPIQTDYSEGVMELRVGSEVEMEIFFGTKRLYEILLPRRLVKTWDQPNLVRK